MKNLSIGKLRSLQRCMTAGGGLSVLALDHRNNLRNALNPQHPEKVSDNDLTDFKLQVTSALAPYASAVLLDPQFSAFQVISSAALPPATGLIVALEATGYSGDAAQRESRILEGWSVAGAKRMGADAVKLLVYYHPDSPTASQIERLVQQVGEDCDDSDMLFMLEPLTYSIDPQQKKLSGQARRDVIVETARRLTSLGGDILKAEFPLDFQVYPMESDWQHACRELTRASAIPWVLLSASVDYETYERQVRIACQQGASGVAAGRAVWKEAVEGTPADRRDFLSGIAAHRMASITALVNEHAAPLNNFYQAAPISSNSYRNYDQVTLK